MLLIYECVTQQHDLRYVVVAGLICLLACYTALSLLARARAAEGQARLAWLSGAALVAGCGIWATHFVAMLAFRQTVPVAYDIGLTALSVAIAVSVTWLGFLLALAGRGGAILGGALAGLAVGSMHYVGMAAVRIPAEAHWHAGYVVASIAIGTVLVAAALRISAADGSLGRRIGGALVYVLGIVGLHFTAMTAVTYVADPRILVPEAVMNPEWLAVAVVAVTVLIIAFGFVGSLVDQHLADRSVREAARLRAYVAQLEDARTKLEQTTANLSDALDAAAASSQAKSLFLATMSHELRTPLNAVIGFSDLVLREPFGPLGDERYRDYTTSIRDSGTHLLGLINDILDISKLDAGRLELEESQIALGAVLSDCVRMVAQLAADRHVALALECEPELPALRADERRVRQVILNLLSNAIKFTPAGGEVAVTAFRRGDRVQIAVTDTGIGIAPQHIARALERFGQVDDSFGRKYEGTGLGLPLSKCLMELHGGTLDLESAEGAGTTVTISFPAARIMADRQAA